MTPAAHGTDPISLLLFRYDVLCRAIFRFVCELISRERRPPKGAFHFATQIYHFTTARVFPVVGRLQQRASYRGKARSDWATHYLLRTVSTIVLKGRLLDLPARLQFRLLVAIGFV